MTGQPPSAQDFHGRAATLLDTPGGVTEPQALVALADAATGLLGLCIDINGKDEYTRDVEARLAALVALHRRFAALPDPSVQLRHLVDELETILTGDIQ